MGNNPFEVVGQQLAKPVERFAVRSFAEVNDVDYLLRHAWFISPGIGIGQPLLHQIEGEQEFVLSQEGVVFLLYYGAPDADRVIVLMGSAAEIAKETVDFLTAQGEKVGLLNLHLYRPFSAKHFLAALPATVKRLAVLDRTKEPGAMGEPLYQDVCSIYKERGIPMEIVGGRYGLSSKDTTPGQILAVYDNLKQESPKHDFTIGIVDDVTFTSLPVTREIKTAPADQTNVEIWGMGSDGTVGANKNSIKIIGHSTDLYCQA